MFCFCFAQFYFLTHAAVAVSSHAAVEYEIVDLSLAEAQTGEQFNLVQATYHNAIKFHEWYVWRQSTLIHQFI